ncbi:MULTISPECIES: phage major capsid protein [Burkholderia cepacia complex]|uniref:Capsid protein n=1 Tax=Burkholderia ubonensis TaxID=101571 RepID=A0A1B4LAX6_9BURK|nr:MULTISPECIES: phage major capsid protein [Burkholderia cepacia complex]AOJ74344.1 capsid protein [Burkholderia ubonensis]AOK10084.1 capsid protein [Burkholderia vietnamiensis]KVF95403.1 capsid protein [Burkholderia vietnamiensis]MBR8084556.1 phage major capsid protein [Burkholderia vietnamiensis]MBR8152629.1 phage major capsid protein [Burkholderia vietnamiensis]
MKLQQLRELRNQKAKEANELNNKYPADQRMPAADAERMDAILAEIEAIDTDIARENRRVQLAADDPAAQHAAALNAATRTPGAHGDESRALRAFMAGGISNMADEDRARMLARQTPDIRNAMSTTTSTEGGFTVATEYQRSLEIAMRAYGGMRTVAHAIRTATGATMNFPTTDPTSEEGEIVGQNVPVSGLDTAFNNLQLAVFKYSSKKIALPFELVQDSFIDIEAYIQSLLAMRLGRVQNRHFTIGDGVTQPNGIVTAVGTGKIGATGQTLNIVYDDFVDLEHSVDPAYRNMPGVGYMMHDSSVKVVRKIKDAQGRPIFVPGYEADAMVNGGAPDRLMGRPITINQHMPVMAANAKSILFGQMSKYVIRDVMDLTIFRMTDSAFTLNGQIGFVGFLRTGGNLIDAGGAVKAYANSAT